jgi:hypothetical protein
MTPTTPDDSIIPTVSLVSAMCCVGVASLAGLIIIPIQTVTCRMQYVTCPKEVLQHTEKLRGTSFFITNVGKMLAQQDLKVVAIHRSFPGNIELTLAYAQTKAQPQVSPTDRASSLLSQMSIDHKQVNQASDSALIVTLPDQRVSLLDPYDLESSVYRLKTILDGVDLATIDTTIKEIDVRFKLPVLRTTITYPTSVNPPPSDAEEDNS